MPHDTSLFERVVSITNRYLGPAAERFVTRQIQNHLRINPVDLRAADLQKLIDWIGIAMSFLTDDSELVHQYIVELEKLTQTSATKE